MPIRIHNATKFAISLAAILYLASWLAADDWPRWRGPDGNAVSRETGLPVQWTTSRNVLWKVVVPGEGASSPIVSGNALFLTSSLDDGTRRVVHRFDRNNGQLVWSREIQDENPELTSALTGYAAPTPVTDGRHVIAFFGNAGVVCFDFEGNSQWHHRFGEFDSELGLASSPVLHQDRVILVCDHDGKSFQTFGSFMIALDVATGAVVWKTDRPKLYRSWSTPILAHTGNGKSELVVNAQDELRGYDPESGQHLWTMRGMTGWVTPSPVFGHVRTIAGDSRNSPGRGLIFASSGRDGPTIAVRPGGRGDVTDSHLVWQDRRGAPYVCSPLLLGDHLYVHNEQGILTCFNAADGTRNYQERLDGKFYASAVGGDGKVYFTNEAGTSYVIRAGPAYQLLAECPLNEECLASPAISNHCIFIRTRFHLYCISGEGS